MLFIFILSALQFACINSSSSSSTQRVIVGGASGYIGRQVVKQLVKRGISTAALIRSDPSELSEITLKYFEGAEIIKCDVLDATSTDHSFLSFHPTAVICCLASRSGKLIRCFDVLYFILLFRHEATGHFKLVKQKENISIVIVCDLLRKI